MSFDRVYMDDSVDDEFLENDLLEDKDELAIIQRTFDFIIWYTPILNGLNKSYKFGLGNRIANRLYSFYEGLVEARYAKQKLEKLELLNIQLQLLRCQTRILKRLKLIPMHRYKSAGESIYEIGIQLGGWIKQQKRK
jgi:23S rRNA-intervening sequence protein